MKKSTLEVIVNSSLAPNRWLWKIENNGISIYGEIGHKSKNLAEEAAYKFINKCLTDRSTWPDEFK